MLILFSTLIRAIMHRTRPLNWRKRIAHLVALVLYHWMSTRRSEDLVKTNLLSAGRPVGEVILHSFPWLATPIISQWDRVTQLPLFHIILYCSYVVSREVNQINIFLYCPSLKPQYQYRIWFNSSSQHRHYYDHSEFCRSAVDIAGN